ncbi:hypothetical protein KL935_001119 [Ogataea polymorpha]|uniref:Peptidase M20 dimerisation domain-containing protein n=2 Tax=Saccharomycotina TaxID=147537 RepID=A0A9P8PE23_9ASCO|nr:hypothetical protein KL935_001119 [Ogataea polymorpha]KAG7911807.1 hypothetical protein KL906_000011 [Ogataea polymorpha]KAH3669569.1 hypothetical protein OGATHE_002381 [Ogataea polymorpha]
MPYSGTRIVSFIVVGLFIVVSLFWSFSEESQAAVECPATKPHRPSTYHLHKATLSKILHSEEFRNASVMKLQAAIRTRTEVYDDDPLLVEDDFTYWSKFEKFEQLLKSTFPLFYSKTTLQKVNYHGLVYIWEGSNSSLKPLVLMAHQDTVPVSNLTLNQWEHDPFSGDYDGENVYGRGVADCKEQLIGLLEAAEELISSEFSPRRTIIYSFGFDEEVGGPRNKNAEWLERKYGKDSMYAVLDEGGVNLDIIQGVKMSVPGTAEKGYMDLKIILETPGGHSSIPPRHTSIGIMGEMIVELEKYEFPKYFTKNNPAFWEYVCVAEHSPEMASSVKKSILSAGHNQKANEIARNYIDVDLGKGFVVKSTRAIDIISGGVKANALPEYVELTMNVRIAMEETVATVVDRVIDIIKPVVDKYHLGLVSDLNGRQELKPSTPAGNCLLKVVQAFPPAPLTPTLGSHWDIFAGTIHHVYEDLVAPDSTGLIVAPGIGSGNTDTKYYWNLTNHIYRYKPGLLPGVYSKEHGINEFIPMDSHLHLIAFYYEYILSVDETDD